MTEGVRRQQTAARRALDEAFLDEERLDDVFDGVARLRQRRGHGIDADRATTIALRDRLEVAPVHGIETGAVDFELAKSFVGDLAVDRLGAVDQREVTY